MTIKSEDAERRAAFAVADLMAAAARTAPKGCVVDEIETFIIEGNDKALLAGHMKDIAKETGEDFYERDGINVDNSHCVVLIGVKNEPLELTNCSLCGFPNCAAMEKAGADCAFKVTDLGIAIGSAVSVAADHRIDNRVLFSAGKGAMRMGLFSEKVRVCFGVPLGVNGKSLFYDRSEQ